MPEISNVLKQKLKHKGFYDFQAFYDFCFEWFKEEGYLLKEELYKEKITPIGKEIEMKWVAIKKISDYFMNYIKVDWLIIGLQDAEVEIDGKKQKTNKAEMKLTFTADLVKDYERRWEDKPFWKFFRGVYDKYIIRTTAEEYEDRLMDKTVELINDIKGFLVLTGKR